MRIAVIGCTISTERCLRMLLREKDCEVVGIVTLDPSVSAAKARFVSLNPVATEHAIPCLLLRDMQGAEAEKFLRNLRPDLLLEVGWSHKIPRAVLALPRLGCIGIHNSLLPANQGAASLNWALIRGEETWGTTLFFLAEKIDAGAIIVQRRYAVTEDDDINTLFDKADTAALEMLREMLPRIVAGTAPRMPQDPARVTKLPRRRPEDGEISWENSAQDIVNLVRALKKPYPPAFTFLRGKKILVCDAVLGSARATGGGVVQSIANGRVTVSATDASVALLRLQAEGEEELSAAAFAERHGLHKGHRLGR